MNEKIRELQQQIENEKQKIGDCGHEFVDAFSNPETVKEPYGSKLVEMGSDSYFEPEGYLDKEIPRWTRICTECGHEQHTYKKKPVVVGHEPDFK